MPREGTYVVVLTSGVESDDCWACGAKEGGACIGAAVIVRLCHLGNVVSLSIESEVCKQ